MRELTAEIRRMKEENSILRDKIERLER